MSNLAVKPTETEFTQVYHDYVGMVRTRARRLVSDTASAEDITQEVFIMLLQYSQRRAVDSIGGLLYQMVTRLAIKRLRQSRRFGILPVPTTDELHLADTEVSLDDRIMFKKLLSQVNEQDALIATYYYVDGMSQDEIANLVQIPRRTIARYLATFNRRAQKYVKATSKAVNESPETLVKNGNPSTIR